MTTQRTEIVSDKDLIGLFAGKNFGFDVTDAKKCRDYLNKILVKLDSGYWVGSTSYSIALNGGFIVDGKSTEPRKFTALGYAMLESMQ